MKKLFLVISILLFTSPAYAGWLSGYTYRKSVSINNANADYQMKLTVNKGSGSDSGATVYLNSHASSWTGTVPNDVRFTGSDGSTELDYWIESSDANTATFWVQNDATPSTTIYIYYGKSSDTTTSNGANTFQFFDDFSGSSLNAQWDDTRGTLSVSGGYLSMGEASGVRETHSAYILNQRVRCRFRVDENAAARIFGLSNTGTATGYFADDGYGISTATGTYALRNSNAGVDTLTNGSAVSTGDYRTGEVTAVSGSIKFYINDSLEATNTTNIPDGNMNPRLHAQAGVSTSYWDWYFVAKFASTEPAFGTWGGEGVNSSNALINNALINNAIINQ